MNLEPIIQSEVEPERGKQIFYTDTYTWNPERWYWRMYFQSSCGDTDVENTLVDTAGERGGEGEMYGKEVTWKHALPHVKQTANDNQMHDAGSSNWGLVTTFEAGWERYGRGVQVGGNTGKPMADSR